MQQRYFVEVTKLMLLRQQNNFVMIAHFNIACQCRQTYDKSRIWTADC